MRHGASRSAVLVLVSAVAALLLAPGTATAEQTIGLSSGTFKFQAAAGQEVRGTVYVSCDGDDPIKVLVYAADQSVSPTGAMSYQAPNRADLTALGSPATWTRLRMPSDSKSLGNLPYIELDPGDRIPVSFAVAVPQGTPPGDHNLVIFFEMFRMPEPGTTQALVSGRVGARVTLRVKGTLIKRLEVRPFAVPAYVVGGRVPYSFLVRNRGNTNQRVSASVLLLDRNGSESATAQPIAAETVYARENLQAEGEFISSGAPLGPHTVRLRVVPVDDEGRELDEGRDAIELDRAVWMVPLWLVVLLAIVLFALLGRIATGLLRERSRARRRGPRPKRRRVHDLTDSERGATGYDARNAKTSGLSGRERAAGRSAGDDEGRGGGAGGHVEGW